MNPLRPLAQLIFPNTCIHCGRTAERGSLCRGCEPALIPLEPPFCDICALPFEGAIHGTFHCQNCHDRQFSFAYARAAWRSGDLANDLIHGLKYRHEIHLAREIGEAVGELICELGKDEPPTPAVLVPVPLHHSRQRERMFNQAAEIARFASKICQLPICHALQRIRKTTPQVQHARAQRLTNLQGAFRLRQKSASTLAARIYLIDDVFTTGSTAEECSKQLATAPGVEKIVVATALRG